MAYWLLLEPLSDARALPRQDYGPFYSQFASQELFSLLTVALAARGSELPVRRCARNLARSPDLRKHLVSAVPSLVAGLSDAGIAGDSAAALCNVACYSEAKDRAFECDAVGMLVMALRREGLGAVEAEDIIACLGVLTSSCEQGMAALFAVAAEQSEVETFAPFIKMFGDPGSPGLQCLVIDVLGGFCAASPQFRDWLVTDSSVVRRELPSVLQNGTAAVCLAALHFSCLVLEADNFRTLFQKAGGVGALQAVLERDASFETSGVGNFGLMARSAAVLPDGARRATTQRDLAQYLLEKILML